MQNFDLFLLDHAAAEKKASAMAISMISHYPDRRELVNTMAEIAIEELNHYREVIKLVHDRGLYLAADEKDQYALNMRNLLRKGTNEYFIDRLLIAGIIEARGCERFGLVANAAAPGKLKDFYTAIAQSEQRHYEVFLQLASLYFPADIIEHRFDELLDLEAGIASALPIQPKLH